MEAGLRGRALWVLRAEQTPSLGAEEATEPVRATARMGRMENRPLPLGARRVLSRSNQAWR